MENGAGRRLPRGVLAGVPMVGRVRARDLAQDLPTVSPDDSALAAARLIAARRLPGIAVVDAGGRPVAVLPASQVLRSVVPGYVQEDPALLKACAGADCTLWFMDRTKAHRRMFCSATACGNRAKVAAFRRRAQRATTA